MTLTPYRYPGAKNRLLPVLRSYIDPLIVNQNQFCDAFVGGGSVLLNMAEAFTSIQLYGNDKDYGVSSFWKIVSDSDTSKMEKLLELMAQHPTLELFYKLREDKSSTDDVTAAYKSIFFNRTTFSGIHYSGPIGGKEQKSKYTVDCRYNFKKLKTKLLSCNKLLRGRTQIDNCDIYNYYILNNTNCPIYLDPPYYMKGDSLYMVKMSAEEHKNLSILLNKRINWVLSYDDCTEIKKLYLNNNIVDLSTRYCINGRKDSWESKNELIILPEERAQQSSV